MTPLGERGRGSHWAITVAWYVAGSVAGGAGLGYGLGTVGSFVQCRLGLSARTAVGVLALVVALGVVLDLGAFGVRLPTVRRQVNEEWLHRYRGWVYGLGFGVQLGVGFSTVVAISAVYGAFAAALHAAREKRTAKSDAMGSPPARVAIFPSTTTAPNC